MGMGHTALPWHCKKLVGVVERGFAIFWTEENGTKKRTFRLDTNNGEFSEKDAEYIVRAANSLPALIAASSALLNQLDRIGGLTREEQQFIDDLRSALALAKGEKA